MMLAVRISPTSGEMQTYLTEVPLFDSPAPAGERPSCLRRYPCTLTTRKKKAA